MSKHTPGPWSVSLDGGETTAGDGFAPIGGCGCCGSPWSNGETKDERDANARLIAAAPDLLKALQEATEAAHLQSILCKNDLPQLKGWQNLALKWAAVIAKARGA